MPAHEQPDMKAQYIADLTSETREARRFILFLALFAATVTIVVCYYEAWNELPFVPIKLSQLGRGKAYETLAVGFALTGLLLLVIHIDLTLRASIDRDLPRSEVARFLVYGDVAFSLIGIINWHSGWMRIAHVPIVWIAFSCYSYFLWHTKRRRSCWAAAAFSALEHFTALLNRFVFPGHPVTFIASALFQYASIAVLGAPVLFGVSLV